MSGGEEAGEERLLQSLMLYKETQKHRSFTWSRLLL